MLMYLKTTSFLFLVICQLFLGVSMVNGCPSNCPEPKSCGEHGHSECYKDYFTQKYEAHCKCDDFWAVSPQTDKCDMEVNWLN